MHSFCNMFLIFDIPLPVTIPRLFHLDHVDFFNQSVDSLLAGSYLHLCSSANNSRRTKTKDISVGN